MNWNKTGFWLIVVAIIYFALSAYGNYLYQRGGRMFVNIVEINLLIIVACNLFRKAWKKPQ